MVGANQKLDKSIVRLLKLLNRKERVMLQKSNNPAKRSLNARGKTNVFDADLFDHCLSMDWVNADGDTVSLTKTGLAALKRALHPDMPFIAQHTVVEFENDGKTANKKLYAVNTGESPLKRLFMRKDKLETGG